MVKLVVSRKYPFVRLTDVGLRVQAEQLLQENEQLRARVIAAQQEKVFAVQQSEELRKQKERLRARVTTLKQTLESQGKVQAVIEAKLQAVREENEALKKR